ncbi:MAG: hypothetical protein EBZ13_10685, partial [Planctomycetia bacterium]|nr:hypothetical protein [Planctomycetia bacterium]
MPAATPASPPAAGYRLPAEWEPHAATWLAWPHRRQTFLGDFANIPPAFVRLVRLLAGYEPVRVIGTGPVLDDATAHLQGIANVELIDIPTSDSWLRDTGPVFLKPLTPGPPRAVVFEFNAWGGKYPPWDADAAVAGQMASRLGFDAVQPGIVLEGGAIETDGEGTDESMMSSSSDELTLNPAGDLDGDGTTNDVDTDVDGDGTDNDDDAFEFDEHAWDDTDGDGMADEIDSSLTTVTTPVVTLCDITNPSGNGGASCTFTVPAGVTTNPVSFGDTTTWTSEFSMTVDDGTTTTSYSHGDAAFTLSEGTYTISID